MSLDVTADKVPSAYVWRRIHSLAGLWLVIFLAEHLFTNSQAALLFGEDGSGFVRAVNLIHNLPNLPLIEFFLLGVPIAMHAIWGLQYMMTSKSNSSAGDGSKPSLTYERSRAYSLQRASSWILLVGIILHVWSMRFHSYPTVVKLQNQNYYFVRLSVDNGLYTVADRLGVKLYDKTAIADYEKRVHVDGEKMQQVEKRAEEIEGQTDFYDRQVPYDSETRGVLISIERYQQRVNFLQEGLRCHPLNSDQVIAVSTNFGDVTLLNVRNAFKNTWQVILYTIFVLAAVYHGFNGFWTFLISWGAVIKVSSQRKILGFSIGVMLIVAFLGLMAIWGTYFLNLRN